MTKKIKSVLKFNIQLFADGATAGVSGAGTATSGETTSSAVYPETDKATAEPKIIYGKQDKDEQQSTKPPSRKSFKELAESEEYSDEAKDYMNKAFSKRMSKYKGLEAENARMKEILALQNERYGLDPSSDTYLDDYADKMQNDKKLYEDEALEAGLSVEQFMKVKNAERIIENNKRFQADREHEDMIHRHIDNLITQSNDFKNEFTNFDLETELDNPTFKRLVDPPEMGGVGLSVKDAFYAIHHNEIMQATAKNIVNQATINTANAVATNKRRPSENGLSNKSVTIVKDDPSQYTKDDFDRIREQIRRTGVAPRF